LKLFICLLAALIPSHVFASTWEISLAPLVWQYQESSAQRFGMGKTPFHSKAQGTGMQTSLSNAITWHHWLLTGSWKGLQSMTSSQEQWNFRQSTQHNQLSIQQSEVKLEIAHRWQAMSLGIWSSYQWHEQSRYDFFVNGVPTTVLGEPIKETVQVIWLGTNFVRPWQAWQFNFNIGIPTWVQTNNILISQKFTTKQGVRLQTSLHYHLSDSPLSLQADYSFRELGGELLSNGWLWPKNRWQTASFGVSCAW